MKKRMLYFIMALALVLCVALPMAAPVVVAEHGGDKVAVWDLADGHPEDVYLLGQTVYYFIEITNYGTQPLEIEKLWDKIPVEYGTWDPIPGVTRTYWWNDSSKEWVNEDPKIYFTIPGGQSWNVTFNYTVREEDVSWHPVLLCNTMINRFLAEGTLGQGIGDTKTVRVIQPAIELVKTVDPEQAQVGQNVTYNFTITNTGDWPLEDITLIDGELGDLTGELPPDLVLNATGEAGDSYSLGYNYTIKAGELPLTNVATVNGTAQDFNATIFPDAVVTASDTAVVVLKSQADIEIKKYVSHNETGPWLDAETEIEGPEYAKGSDVYFKFVVTNTGNVELYNVIVSDTDFSLSDWPIPILDLAPSGETGDSVEYVLGPVAAISGQHSNEATATGYPPPTAAAVFDYDMAHYFGAGPSIDVEKAVWDEIASTWKDADTPAGPSLKSTQDPVVFKFEIDNDGNVDLTGVNLTDTDMTKFYTDFDCTANATFPMPSPLAPDDPPVIVYGKVGWAQGQHSNNATATGTPPSGPAVSDYDPAHYFGLGPDIDIEKRTNNVDADSEPGPYITVGSTVTWTYIVKNTGGVNLTDVVVTDDRLGPIGTILSLPVGAEQTLYAPLGTAEAGQYVNNATVVGHYDTDEVTDWDLSHYFGREVTVGWETYPINKVQVLLPWIGLLGAIIAGASLLVLRHRRAQS